MKLADKLFFATTAVLTAIFALFGTWLLHSYFSQILNRQIEQGNMEGLMFHHLYEMAYQTMEEYGDEYAVRGAVDSVVKSVENENTACFVMEQAGEFLYGETLGRKEGFAEAARGIVQELPSDTSYGYGIQRLQEGFYFIHISASTIGAQPLFLGICRDLTESYEDRQTLLNQYRLFLTVLILAGGFCIYLYTRYMTGPIRKLGRIAGDIAAGNYEQRSLYKSPDEIGQLAASFNKMADSLVEQMQEKELEARQKEDFTAAFAHELKTPLTSIIGYADMINTVELTEEERQEATLYIYSQGKRLESLSHKLLELVGMDRQSMNAVPVDTKKLEENIRMTMRPIFRDKKIKSKISLEKSLLWGDYELLLSLFYNLLDNARKAVEEDGFILFKGEKTDNGYEIRIADNGCGIPAEEIARITEAFYMVDKSRSRKEGGAGLGMALCQRIITLHNGVMSIHSNPGEGTIIRLIFPEYPEM